MKLILLLSIFLSCTTPEKEEIKNIETYSYTHSSKEIQILESVNQYRESKGLNRLFVDESVSFICFEHSEYMHSNNSFTHTGFDSRLERIGVKNGGENLTRGLDNPIQSWIASPSHKANLESNWTHFGVGEKNGYVTLIMIRR